jgi:hypothetical protein
MMSKRQGRTYALLRLDVLRAAPGVGNRAARAIVVPRALGSVACPDYGRFSARIEAFIDTQLLEAV